MVLSIFQGVSNQLLALESNRVWEKQEEKSVKKCLFIFLAQKARVDFLCTGVKRKTALAVCLLASSNTASLSNEVSKILDAVEIIFSVHSILFGSALYGVGFLAMRMICHIAENNDDNLLASRIKFLFTGYFSALSSLVLSRGFSLFNKCVNALFFTKIGCDYYVSNNIQSTVHTQDRTCQERVNEVFCGIVKSSWKYLPALHFESSGPGVGPMPKLLVASSNSGVESTSFEGRVFDDPYIVGKFDYRFSFLFSRAKDVLSKLISASGESPPIINAIVGCTFALVSTIKTFVKWYFLGNDKSSQSLVHSD